ncbi:hypothetical protein ACFV0O_27000 [Kitasatospora sp. NPDC059577]|uniref:hypothetical protein n=1 Tax=unclassified Kitasatospora TaxID=2633591 RepID=UPI0036B58254
MLAPGWNESHQAVPSHTTVGDAGPYREEPPEEFRTSMRPLALVQLVVVMWASV